MTSPAPDELPPLQGGCLCGRVRYEARPSHRDGYYCHCRMCQLAVGNTRAAFFNLRKDQVRWTAAEPTLFASSRIAQRGFCGTCGTPLSFAFNEGDNMDLSVGSLDNPSLLKPIVHYGVESWVANWHVDDGLPGRRLDENDGINKRWRDAYGADVHPGTETARRG